jgi:AraC-like DNA-binding protein
MAANVSPFHFARLFKNTTGLAPHKFVLRLRLERAKRLIASQASGETARLNLTKETIVNEVSVL